MFFAFSEYCAISFYIDVRIVVNVRVVCSKRNGGMPDECRGRYDPAIYTTLDNICEDCYNLYKEPDIHSMCRSVGGC